jgi:hypothetical protein
MNRGFRPLTCFSIAMFFALSNDAIALARHKQAQHARKADTATAAAHQRKSALRRGASRHGLSM